MRDIRDIERGGRRGEERIEEGWKGGWEGEVIGEDDSLVAADLNISDLY